MKTGAAALVLLCLSSCAVVYGDGTASVQVDRRIEIEATVEKEKKK